MPVEGQVIFARTDRDGGGLVIHDNLGHCGFSSLGDPFDLGLPGAERTDRKPVPPLTPQAPGVRAGLYQQAGPGPAAPAAGGS